MLGSFFCSMADAPVPPPQIAFPGGADGMTTKSVESRRFFTAGSTPAGHVEMLWGRWGGFWWAISLFIKGNWRQTFLQETFFPHETFFSLETFFGISRDQIEVLAAETALPATKLSSWARASRRLVIGLRASAWAGFPLGPPAPAAHGA
jgi:hypothetical protein